MTTKTWIITGVSQGFGRELAVSALRSGDAVVAAIRRPESVADIASANPDRFSAVTFDVRDTAAAPSVVEHALEHFGRVDVLVNNAGRGMVGAAEMVDDSALRDLMELHLIGPAALVRAVLPSMRAQGSGTIVQMSSQGGRMSFPGVGAYSASKFALEGWSEALAGEVGQFGIRVMIVEPSRFRTAFNTPGVLSFAESSSDYRDLLDPVLRDMAAADGVQEGDPEKAAAIINALVHSENVPLRLPLGKEAVERVSASYRKNLAEVSVWADLARSADFADAAGPVRPF
ncbi:SDR family NAD(P)-dependent oxidoreductase [Rhodococcus sp. IEGM 1318]|uniref:SDR family NAD(P)-dependent oxidoreductase n=1 Tax=Rhodococcus sp. IEGM 1318 TaxID=3082226 RepID=UPI00295455AD|nr:SDR family NAD(P)-dependent oxidoreductase [Rhodococcus sp. IEGM 1318]MDV8004263.1 SDR family NAD(P)-dependent oxidoreductase [Rhodococcus sp. IEGM 1318]